MDNKANGLITIRNEGHSKVIAVTKLFPKNWRYITAKVIKSNKNRVIVEFEKVR